MPNPLAISRVRGQVLMASNISVTPEPYVYAGAGTGGLYRKAPGEDRWKELTDGLPSSPEVRVIAIHPLQSDVIFAGTQDGVYRSASRGDHWETPQRARGEQRCLVNAVPPPHSQRDVCGHGTRTNLSHSGWRRHLGALAHSPGIRCNHNVFQHPRHRHGGRPQPSPTSYTPGWKWAV